MASDAEIKQLFSTVFNDIVTKRGRAIDSWSASKKKNEMGFENEMYPTMPPWLLDIVIDSMIDHTIQPDLESELTEEERRRDLEKMFKNKLFELDIFGMTDDRFIYCDTTKFGE